MEKLFYGAIGYRPDSLLILSAFRAVYKQVKRAVSDGGLGPHRLYVANWIGRRDRHNWRIRTALFTAETVGGFPYHASAAFSISSLIVHTWSLNPLAIAGVWPFSVSCFRAKLYHATNKRLHGRMMLEALAVGIGQPGEPA